MNSRVCIIIYSIYKAYTEKMQMYNYYCWKCNLIKPILLKKKSSEILIINPKCVNFKALDLIIYAQMLDIYRPWRMQKITQRNTSRTESHWPSRTKQFSLLSRYVAWGPSFTSVQLNCSLVSVHLYCK